MTMVNAEQCERCPDTFRQASAVRGTAVTCVCGWVCEMPAESATPARREAMPVQRVAPPVVTLAPCPDRNRRRYDRAWSLIPDMNILNRHFSYIEGRAQSIEPSVQNGGGIKDDDDRRQRERSTAVKIHQRWQSLGWAHVAVIKKAMIHNDGSKLGDDDAQREDESAAQFNVRIRMRDAAFERLAVAFATKKQAEAWRRNKAKAIVQQAKRKIGRALFVAARAAYEGKPT